MKFGNRVVFRKSDRYIVGQFISSEAAQDRVLVQAHSKELIMMGWPKEFGGSLKSLPACYLTGLLLGKRVIEKFGKQEAILDLGILRNIPKSRISAFAKGVIKAGILLRYGADLPEDTRIQGGHMKKEMTSILNKVSKSIEHE